jgi:hypothetical protein
LTIKLKFYPLLNGILMGEMTKHYWMICDHEMLGYCAIFKGLGQLKLQT